MTNDTTLAAEPGRHDYFIVREFDAPRELDFKAFTDPDLLAVAWSSWAKDDDRKI